jgi:hypothetical protein
VGLRRGGQGPARIAALPDVLSDHFSAIQAGSSLLYKSKERQIQWSCFPNLSAGSRQFVARGSRIFECLASATSLDDIDQSFDGSFLRQALPEVLKAASEITDSYHMAA